MALKSWVELKTLYAKRVLLYFYQIAPALICATFQIKKNILRSSSNSILMTLKTSQIRQELLKFVQGQLNALLENALSQFIDFSLIAPPSIFKFRRRELLELIYHSGYTDISSLNMTTSLSEKVQALISDHLTTELTAEFIASQLFMSSSTLRRKLKSEGNSIQDIRNRVRLGHGLHLIQTTNTSIGNIAFECGYQSQSRFTEQFKNLFGITPRKLRKTKMLT